jgi:hypothetical protein
LKKRRMARKPRGQGRPPGAPGPQQHSQPPRPQGGGGWAPLRDAIRRDVEQASAALAFATALHERLEAQRRLFADFPRVMEQLRSGALERVGTALARLFEGKDQFDLTRFLRDLPLALAQLAAAEAARKGAQREQAGPADAASAASSAAATSSPPATSAPPPPDTASEPPLPPAAAGDEVTAAPDDAGAPAGEPLASQPETPANASPSEEAPAGAPASEPPRPPSSSAGHQGNGGAPAEAPSPRLELRAKLLAAAPQLTKAVITYRRTVATVRRAAAPRRAPGPWRSDREVLEEARLAVDFARQLFDAYADAWADQPTQPGSAEAMSAETDRFLAWTQLARYMEVAAPRSQPPPVDKAAEKVPEKPADKQPVTQGSPGAGAGAPPAEPEPLHSA